MRCRKKISFLLFLSFSAMLGHSLFPHHHHAEVVIIAVNEKCPIDHEDHHDEDDHSMHCHAFNSIDYVYSGQSEIQRLFRVNSSGLVPVHTVEMKQLVSLDFKRYNSLIIPDKTTKYFGANSMRAPPLSA